MGLIPRSIDQIFHSIEDHDPTEMSILVRMSFLEIYNEEVKGDEFI
jgi:hypothetical protein